jgi:hypothetical protein
MRESWLPPPPPNFVEEAGYPSNSTSDDSPTTIQNSIKEPTMNSHWSNQCAIIAMFALLVLCPASVRGQDTGGSMAGGMQQAAALTGDQQSAANSALCSAVGSHFPNPASAGPSALSDPAVMSTAASSFAGSAHLPLPSATDMLKGYVAQHATDILASCAVSNATGGMTLPSGGGGLPSIPKMP